MRGALRCCSAMDVGYGAANGGALDVVDAGLGGLGGVLDGEPLGVGSRGGGDASSMAPLVAHSDGSLAADCFLLRMEALGGGALAFKKDTTLGQRRETHYQVLEIPNVMPCSGKMKKRRAGEDSEGFDLAELGVLIQSSKVGKGIVYFRVGDANGVMRSSDPFQLHELDVSDSLLAVSSCAHFDGNQFSDQPSSEVEVCEVHEVWLQKPESVNI